MKKKEIYLKFERPNSKKGFCFVYANTCGEKYKIIIDDEYGDNIGLEVTPSEYKQIYNELIELEKLIATELQD